VPGAIVCVQSFGALVHWHPHLHVLVTDGAFARDGRFTLAKLGLGCPSVPVP